MTGRITPLMMPSKLLIIAIYGMHVMYILYM